MNCLKLVAISLKFIDDQNVNHVIRCENTCNSKVWSSEKDIDFHEVMKSSSADFNTNDEVPLSKMGKSLSGHLLYHL